MGLVTDSAYEELTRLRHPGPVALDLLRRLVHQVRRSYGFPPPEDHTQWSDEAADEVVLAMLARKEEGREFVTRCFVLAADDASLERLFLTSIKYYLIDEAKKTPRGKLRRRIAGLMSRDTVYRKSRNSPPRWALADHAEEAVWQGDLDDLIAQAARVRGVGITRWNHSGPTPRQTVHALKTILVCVLQHAQGAVREEDLAKVLEARFELLAPARVTRLFADEGTVVGAVEQHAATIAPDPTATEGRPRTSGSVSPPTSGCCFPTSRKTPTTPRNCLRSRIAMRPQSCPTSRPCSVMPCPKTATGGRQWASCCGAAATLLREQHQLRRLDPVERECAENALMDRSRGDGETA